MAAKITQETFIQRSEKIHGGKYGYSPTVYIRGRGKVTITCPIHGNFSLNAYDHLSGYGCQKWGKERQTASKKYDTNSFIQKAQLTHGDAYDYSHVTYVSSRVPISIVCKKHGIFKQTPADHLTGKGCHSCGRKKANDSLRISKEEFIMNAVKLHQNVYDYSLVEYVTYHTKVKIICAIHGVFLQKPAKHITGKGHGCPACGLIKVSVNQRGNISDFIAKCLDIHKGKYDYSKTIYTLSNERLEIGCPKHGSFFQVASDHMGGHGCPSCMHQHSKPHKQIEDYIRGLGITFESNTRRVIPPLELDIWIPPHNLAIEFNGRYWHSLDGTEPAEVKFKHRNKYLSCKEKGVILLQIDEHEWKNPITQDIWMSIIASKLGKTTKIPARKTSFMPVSLLEAREFLAANHLQGATNTIRWAFGLYYREELIGLITFCNHQKDFINLSRLAFKRNITVVGGAQKLFKNALPHLPDRDILSFSANRYSQGSIYPLLGFDKDKDLPPSYQWYFQNQIRNKRSLRRSCLQKLLGDQFNPAETEHQNLYRNGVRCLYDAGYQRWLYKKSTTKH